MLHRFMTDFSTDLNNVDILNFMVTTLYGAMD